MIFTGFIPKEQLFELYAIADVGITPSLHEEFGYVAVEMMMNKLPVIASNSTGLKEILDDGKYGLLVDMNDSDKIVRLKNRMIEMLLCPENKRLYKELSRQRYIEEYSMNVFNERIKLLYHKI